MNIAMILEMAADALGDRLAYGTRADGLSYEGLRQAARGIAERVDGTGAERLALMESNAPIVPATLFGAAWAGVSYAPLNYRLPEAQLEALLGRIEPAVVSAPHWLDNKGTQRPRLPRRPRRPRRAPLHQRHVGRAQGRDPRARPTARLHLQHARVRVGRRGRSRDRRGAAVPRRRRRRRAQQHLRGSPHRAGARRALLRRGLARHRPRRRRDPRHARPHHARQDRRGHGGRRVAAGPHAAGALLRRGADAPVDPRAGAACSSPRSTSSTPTGSPRPAAPSPSSVPTTTASPSTATNPSSPPASVRSASRCRASSSASSASRARPSDPTSPARS